MIKAKELRNADELKTIPNNLPGYYKWWADRDELDVILSALEISYEYVIPYLETNDNRQYAVYVGIAAKESVRKRLDWHVNDKHTPNRVRTGTLSTLRQSIAGITAHNQFDKVATDSFIDQLDIEYHTIDEEIRSQEAVQKLHVIERKMLTDNLYLLNIQDNKHPLSNEIKKRLKRLRKEAKHSDQIKECIEC